jgi:hypothetical protein
MLLAIRDLFWRFAFFTLSLLQYATCGANFNRLNVCLSIPLRFTSSEKPQGATQLNLSETSISIGENSFSQNLQRARSSVRPERRTLNP